MKKLIFTSLAMFGLSAMAQVSQTRLPEKLQPNTKRVLGVETMLERRAKSTSFSKAGSSGWLELDGRMQNNGSVQYTGSSASVPPIKSFAYRFYFMFPDSTVNNVILDNSGTPTLSSPNYHMVGNTFDGRSLLFNPLQPAGNVLTNYTPYSIDSIRISYLYERHNPDVNIVDTLIFQLFYPNYTTNDTVQNSPFADFFSTAADDNSAFAALNYNNSANLGALVSGNVGNLRTIKVPLTTADVTINANGELVIGTKSIAVNPILDLQPRTRFAITYNFKPGYSYSFGDTLDADSTILPLVVNKKNYFRAGVIEDYSSLTEADKRLNPAEDRLCINPLIAITESRYDLFTPTATNIFNQYFYFLGFTRTIGATQVGFDVVPDIAAHITNALRIGVNEIKNDQFAMGNVYPNPTEMGTNSVLAFSLKQAATVEVKIFNIAGQMVKSVMNKNLVAGEHTEVLDVTGLRAGIYMVNMTVNGVSQTKKLTIVD